MANYLQQPAIRSQQLAKQDSGAARLTARRKRGRIFWGSGQGVGQMDDVSTTAVLVERLKAEYREAVAAQVRNTAAYL